MDTDPRDERTEPAECQDQPVVATAQNAAAQHSSERPASPNWAYERYWELESERPSGPLGSDPYS